MAKALKQEPRVIHIKPLYDVTVKDMLCCRFPHCNYYAIHNIDVYTNVFIIHNAFFIIIHGNESEKMYRKKKGKRIKK